MSVTLPNLADGVVSPMVRVRGLRAPQAGPICHCLHCGVPLVGEAAHQSGFCCAGCGYVYRLVHERGLDGYYKIRDAVVAPVDPSVFQARDVRWLAELQENAEKAPGTPELELEVQGISCAGCVWLIERLFHQQPGALDIETDAQLGRLRMRWTKGEFHAAQFARTLHSFNYVVGPMGEEPAVAESRGLARRIGLCAAFSMNVMLFTLPAYFGMTADFAYARLFGLLAMAFATFSLLTGGVYFLNRAARALRDGVVHIDLPIAVGIVGAYAGSLVGWLIGRDDLVYFDFVSAFILLMLIGRWAQTVAVERNRHRLLRGQLKPAKVWIKSPAGRVEKTAEELAAGELFIVRPGQVIPVESHLESTAATLGTAWINGEAAPHTGRHGGLVPAGAVNLGHGEIELRATQPWSASLLAQLLRPARRDTYRHAFLERIIRGYLIGIFAMAIIAGVAWWLGTHDVVRTWSVVTAVLVVSCPCAIGLAFPLTDELATSALRRRGVFIRESDLWPKLARIRKIIFDKTGTLTLETPVLENPGALVSLTGEARAALLALVRENAHPVSQSLRENLLAAEDARSVPSLSGEFSEEVGFGVVLQTSSRRWSLGRPGWRGHPTRTEHVEAGSSEGTDAEFACDGAVLARFRFIDATRPRARDEIAALRRLGFSIHILSGDRQEKVAAMASALGVEPANAIGETTPGEKAEWVRRLDRRDTLMLGDGANDSLAFDAALARGTPVIHRGVLEGKSDFYYLGQSLDGLSELFRVARQRQRAQRWLLVFSILYNVAAVGLAVAGYMHPLMAAILMPLSSLATLAITLLGMRGNSK
ncbi:MAG: heavy metal translocating P-type ATPase metal-binding domain-containing protein [Lacunisphaera sp.]